MEDNIAGTVSRLPTVEEILAGQTQAGVVKPPSLSIDEDDGTVQRVGSTPVLTQCLRPAIDSSRWRTFWSRAASLFRSEKVR